MRRGEIVLHVIDHLEGFKRIVEFILQFLDFSDEHEAVEIHGIVFHDFVGGFSRLIVPFLLHEVARVQNTVFVLLFQGDELFDHAFGFGNLSQVLINGIKLKHKVGIVFLDGLRLCQELDAFVFTAGFQISFGKHQHYFRVLRIVELDDLKVLDGF